MSRTRSQPVVKELPKQTIDLSDDQMTTYLSRIARDAEGISIRVKDSATSHERGLERLGELHVQLLNKRIFAAEVAYELSGEHWVDTFTVTHRGARLVREQQRAVLTA